MAAFESIQDYIAARSYYSAEVHYLEEAGDSEQEVSENRARISRLSQKINELTDAELGLDRRGQAVAAQAARFSGGEAAASPVSKP